MKPDVYTKAVITVIAVMLMMIVVRPFFTPNVTAFAQGGRGSQAGEVNRYTLQQINQDQTTVVLDTKTGQLWRLEKFKCGNETREIWTRMPGLGKNELPAIFSSCSTPPAGR